MLNTIEASWPVLAAVVVLALLIAGWLLSRGRSGARAREYQPDVLDEGAAPAQRNQALIDAAPAAQIVSPAFAGTMAGLGEVVAVAAQEEVVDAAPPVSYTHLRAHETM
jgi:hypothetical protein